MKITYDPTCSAFYISLADRRVGHIGTREVFSDPMILVDIDDEGTKVGVEILAPLLGDSVRAGLVLDVINAKYPPTPVNLSMPEDGTQGLEVRALYDAEKNIFYLRFREGMCARCETIAKSPEGRLAAVLVDKDSEVLGVSVHGAPDDKFGIELCVFNYYRRLPRRKTDDGLEATPGE